MDLSTSNSGVETSSKHRSGKLFESNRLVRVLYVFLLAGIAVLLISIAFIFGANSEAKYINTNDFQAVNVSGSESSSGDQIYYGKIKSLNSGYIVLDNVYYTTSSSSVSVVPLVCQTGQPFDQLIISRNSVNWWENLQPTSKVSANIASYVKNNPDGATCPKLTT